MKSVFRAFLPYLIVSCLIFYVLPLPAVLDTRATDTSLFMYALLIIFPAVSFITHILFALKHGFVWYLPLLTGALFAPTVFLYYNQTAVVYIFSYIVLAYIGAAAGYSIYKSNRRSP